MSMAIPASVSDTRPADAQTRYYPDRRVYVVTAWESGGNDRVRKLLSLRDRFDGLVLVTPGNSNSKSPERLTVITIPNFLGVLRVLGLHALKVRLERYLYFPSVHVLFIAKAKRRIARCIAADLAAGRQVTLLTTAPPHALGLIGLYVKRRCPGVRWVLDWQDLWTYDENYYLRIAPLYRPRVRRLEREMLDNADLNLTTNGRARQVLAEQYNVPARRLLHIHHHYHPADFSMPAEDSSHTHAGPGTPLKIGFLGTLFKPPRVPGMELVGALEDIRSSGLNVELHVHGHVPDGIREAVARSPAVHLHGRVSHEEGVRQLASYDYLLLLLADLPNCRAVMSIKLPHYMMADRPILAIVPSQSAIADIVHETGTGHVIPVEQDWRAQLRDVISRHGSAANSVVRRHDIIEEFSWDRLSNRWMEAIVGGEAAA